MPPHILRTDAIMQTMRLGQLTYSLTYPNFNGRIPTAT